LYCLDAPAAKKMRLQLVAAGWLLARVLPLPAKGLLDRPGRDG